MTALQVVYLTLGTGVVFAMVDALAILNKSKLAYLAAGTGHLIYAALLLYAASVTNGADVITPSGIAMRTSSFTGSAAGMAFFGVCLYLMSANKK